VGIAVAHARLVWFLTLLVVPAALAGLALLLPEQPSAPAAPATPVPREAGPLPAVRAPVVPKDPPAAEPPLAQLVAVQAAEPIRFGADSVQLAGPPAATVQRVAELLMAAPAAQVLVEGHVADTPGRPEAAQLLSEQRAAVVAEALVAAGVPADRIIARGLGAQRPLATVEESRRVEVRVG
jgi:outer membrane protein OmpA-like peptidoglycan-associated protein